MFHSLLLLSLSALIRASPSASIDESAYSSSSIIRRDVCIIGGGSSGTYAAIGLRDKGKSVAVIEAQGVLGGHTNTYTDPATNETVDYGVVEFDNTTIVTDYFKRFGIPLTTTSNAGSASLKQYYVDFTTGKNVTGYVPTNPASGFAAYAGQLAKYPFLNTPGWDLPDPVPADLLIPFGDFVKKYSIDSAVFTINEYAEGFGNILSIPTLYVLKYFGQAVLEGAQTGFLTTARDDNGELYEKAQAELGADVFLNSRAIATERNNASVKVVVKTASGPKLILAKKLVVSVPPLLSNLAGFDLSTTERSLFSQFQNGAYYTSLVRNTGIPDDISITNVGAGTPYNLPTVPAIYGVSPTRVSGLKSIQFGASSAFPSDASVKAAILSEIAKLKTAGTITTIANPEFAAYNNHTPYELRVSAAAVENGFYKQLTSLQGQENTWWTGAAFDKHDSGDLWAFTNGLLDSIAA
ncbi:flavin-containing superfamily amine oxidase-like protein [Usnea florida]